MCDELIMIQILVIITTIINYKDDRVLAIFTCNMIFIMSILFYYANIGVKRVKEYSGNV